MKKFYVLMLAGILLTGTLAAQNSIVLTFSGQNNGHSHPLDSISVENITLGGSIMLYGSDTVLMLVNVTGVPSVPAVGSGRLTLYPACPNPFTGSTAVRFLLTRDEHVIIRVYDLLGREHIRSAQTLGAGEHRFTFSPARANHYLISVETGTQKKVQKVVSLGGTDGNCILQYDGWESGVQATQKALSQLPWMPGNVLKYIGYASLCSNIPENDSIMDIPVQSSFYFFDFSVSETFKCGDSITFCYRGLMVKMGTVNHLGMCWLDRNLGAVNVPDSANDATGFGDLFQWGRGADGHQIPTSSVIHTISNAVVPGHGLFISNNNPPIDWLSPQNNMLWQGVDGINNPCPFRWRIPTQSELNAEVLSWQVADAAGAFSSPLHLPKTNFRSAGGVVNTTGQMGFIWSSSTNGTNARAIFYGLNMPYGMNAGIGDYARAGGMPVRCIRSDTAVMHFQPQASFSVSDTIKHVNMSVQFTDLSLGMPNSWTWYFGDGDSSSQQHPTHSYTSNGNYTVTLIASNNYGSDTIVKSNLVEVYTMGQPCPGIPTVTDINGSVYNTVKIGTQCWMRENFRARHLNNSTPIPEVIANSAWSNTTTAARCWYNHDSASYGGLGIIYNGWAIAGGNLCPSGWHVASLGDWDTLVNYLGVPANAATKLKDTILWNSSALPGIISTNESGFSALPGGSRGGGGIFGGIYNNSQWWTSTIFTTGQHAAEVYMDRDSNSVSSYFGEHFSWGNYVRCVKNN